jgi:molybdopterin-guanine dinucleotide biosynthesis protein A
MPSLRMDEWGGASGRRGLDERPGWAAGKDPEQWNLAGGHDPNRIFPVCVIVNAGCIALALLMAGGRSRRMGTDKCLLDWSGLPLWKHQLETLRALKPARLAVSSSIRPEWLPDEIEWLPDAVEHAGPFSGVISGLEAVQDGLILVLAVDLPWMSPAWFLRLMDEGSHVARHGAFGPYEPLGALYPACLAASSRKWLESGRRDFQGWIQEEVQRGFLCPHDISLGEKNFFRNLNSKEDLPPNSNE